jgi:hypothetical protein
VLTDFDRAQVDRFKQATEQKLRDVRCPEHRQPPRIRFRGTSLRDIDISLSGCCGKVMDLANQAISGELPSPGNAEVQRPHGGIGLVFVNEGDAAHGHAAAENRYPNQ